MFILKLVCLSRGKYFLPATVFYENVFLKIQNIFCRLKKIIDRFFVQTVHRTKIQVSRVAVFGSCTAGTKLWPHYLKLVNVNNKSRHLLCG
jgi:hypothetical protein